jgi:hypothetical protein
LLFFAASGDEQHDLRVIGEINASDFAARVRRANAAN